MVAPPKVSAFPWERLPRLSYDQARAESLAARWIAAGTSSSASTPAPRLAKLLRLAAAAAADAAAAAITARVVPPSTDFDPHAAACVVKADGAEVVVRGSSTGVLALANRILGGPTELAAPRPLNVVEQSVWCLVVATALEDVGLPGIVWPLSENRTKRSSGSSSSVATRAPAPATGSQSGSGSGTLGGVGVVELGVQAAGLAFAIQLQMPGGLPVRAPPGRSVTTWAERVMPTWAKRVMFDVPVVVARCALGRADLGRLAVRSLVTVGAVAGVRVPRVGKPVIGGADLEIFAGTVGIRPTPAGPRASSGGAPDVVAEVVSGYVPRAMSLPDDAHVELTVGLGTTRMSLRQICELSVGQVVTLGRPLGGPFELRAAGKLVGKGELVDVDGELAVRIVSLGDQE